ncbi:sortase, partial [Jiangella ureilytica]
PPATPTPPSRRPPGQPPVMPSAPPVVPAGAGDALRLPGLAVTIVGVLLLGFVGQLALLSQLGHTRAQELAFDEFRVELANGTAPIGQLNRDDAMWPLGTAMAVLEIPALDLHEVVFEGTTSAVLQDGAGHRRDTVFPGQEGTSVVMGRQATYGGPFGRLDLLQPGEPFTVTTGQGAHTYHVTGVRREGDPQPPPLADGEGRLTLVTAGGDPFRPDGVLRVDAELVSDPVPTPRRPFRSADLPAEEQAMKGDPSGWVAVMLWAQATAFAAVGVAWASVRWGKAQAWTIGVPLLGGLGIALADAAAVLLPNLM